VLALQRSAGNQAVGRMLARKPKHTGLRDDAVISRFVAKALSFSRRNGDAPLTEYADYLGAAVNTELEALGVPAVTVSVAKGSVGGAAEFHADGWYILLNPDEFSHTGAKTIGELSEQEASLLAGRVMHEARHAEQHFRVARLNAAEGKDQTDADVADAAAAAPLRGSSQEVREAREWRTNETGEDAEYREVVTWWQSDAHEAALLASQVDDAGAPGLRGRIASKLHNWNRPDGPVGIVAAHLAGAHKRHKAEMVADIQAINAAFAQVDGAFQALPETPSAADFASLTAALGALTRATTHAYYDQPVENDAYDIDRAGVSAYDRAAAP
jgi:hypothetical protein